MQVSQAGAIGGSVNGVNDLVSIEVWVPQLG